MCYRIIIYKRCLHSASSVLNMMRFTNYMCVQKEVFYHKKNKTKKHTNQLAVGDGGCVSVSL